MAIFQKQFEKIKAGALEKIRFPFFKALLKSILNIQQKKRIPIDKILQKMDIHRAKNPLLKTELYILNKDQLLEMKEVQFGHTELYEAK